MLGELFERSSAPGGRFILQDVLQAVEILTQAYLRIDIVAVVQNSNRPGVAIVDDGSDHVSFMNPWTDWKNLIPESAFVDAFRVSHAVHVQAQQVRLHQLEGILEIVDVSVPVVKVVDDSHVPGVMVVPQVLADGHQVSRSPPPSAVVVQTKLEPQITSLLDKRQHRLGGGFDLLLLRAFLGRMHVCQI